MKANRERPNRRVIRALSFIFVGIVMPLMFAEILIVRRGLVDSSTVSWGVFLWVWITSHALLCAVLILKWRALCQLLYLTRGRQPFTNKGKALLCLTVLALTGYISGIVGMAAL